MSFEEIGSHAVKLCNRYRGLERDSVCVPLSQQHTPIQSVPNTLHIFHLLLHAQSLTQAACDQSVQVVAALQTYGTLKHTHTLMRVCVCVRECVLIF